MGAAHEPTCAPLSFKSAAPFFGYLIFRHYGQITVQFVIQLLLNLCAFESQNSLEQDKMVIYLSKEEVWKYSIMSLLII